MNIKSGFFFLIILLLSSPTHGQEDFYIIDESPSRLKEIEKYFLDHNSDTIVSLCKAFLQNSNNTKNQGIAYFYQAQAEASIHNDGFSLGSFDQAISLFQDIQFKKGLAMAYQKKADVYFFLGNYIEADSLYQLAISFAENPILNEVLIDAFQKKANIEASLQESASAIRFLKKALQYASNTSATNKTKNIISEIATTYHAEGQLDSAVYYFQKILALKIKLKDDEGLISDYISLGKLQRERGTYEAAQYNLFEALKIAESKKDTFSLTTIYSEVGDLYASQNIWPSAKKYYSNAIQLSKAINNRFIEASAYKKLGLLFQYQNKKQEAIQSYGSALKIYERLNHKINAANVLMSLSELYSENKQFSKAKSLLLDALETRKTSKDLLSTLSIKMALGKIEIKFGNIQKGINYIQECLPIFEDMEDLEGLRSAYTLMAKGHEKKGDYKKAYLFQQSFQTTNDSLVSVNRAKAMEEFGLLYNKEKDEKRLAQRNEKIKIQEVALLTKNNQILMLSAGLGLLALLAALAFFIYFKNKQLNQQRIAVLKKEKETQRLKSVIEGEEKERKRFARELHDGLGAVLATVKMQISGIQHKLPQAQSMPMYQKAETLIDDACRTVREISHDLMPHVLEQQGLNYAISDMCQNLESHNDIIFDFIPFGDDESLSNILKITIYRITQELLKNSIKHAQAKEVIVQLTIEEKEVMLIIEDDGKGFDTSTIKNGIGLENIRSRTEYLNGILDIDSIVNQGSTFTITLPLNSK